jgi:hypothetical protein
MKRTVIGVLVFSFLLLAPASDAQRRRRGRSRPVVGKSNISCPTTLNSITDCLDTGCGLLDPNLNRQKNIRSDNQAVVPMDIADIQALPDPVPLFKIGDTREKLQALGEGKKITVVAWALIARLGSSESCNCHLTRAADTDNHIVLIDPNKRRPTLADEPDSTTAEFTPRVRLDHPKLKRTNLQSKITAGGGRVLVRVTGLLMFDSEHSLGPHLAKGRHNNWEIHPVMGLEVCPPRKRCTANSDANWVDIEK